VSETECVAMKIKISLKAICNAAFPRKLLVQENLVW